MEDRARLAYLQSQVMTASPQKLQWMLLDGALRYATQAETAWAAGNAQQASEHLDRCRQIIAEIASSLRPDRAEVAQQALAIYLWMFRSLAEAQLMRDSAKLADVIRVLKIERETWRQVCEQTGSEKPEQPAGKSPTVPPLAFDSGPMAQSPGISFEA